ncbi:MAG: gliding motility protein GldM [Flavobacteriaceae bacterium]|nr:gliding motility protein GldM [Flavobacteriaceae bacterium]
MAGAKETPRQKLISLMYLVFITMLALNVSKEVLDGFGQMYEKISDANTRVDESNDNIFENIKVNAEEKGGKWIGHLRTAKEIKEESDAFYDRITEIMTQITEKQREKDPELKEYAQMDKGEALDVIFFKEGSDQAASEFLDMINNYKMHVIQVFGSQYPEYIEMVEARFDTGDENGNIQNRDGMDQPWFNANFQGFPLVSSLAKFAMMQNDVRQTEHDVFATLMGKELKMSSNVNESNYISLLKTEKGAYYQGETFDGSVVLGRKGGAQNPNRVDLKLDGRALTDKDYDLIAGGIKLKVGAGSPGDHEISGNLIFLNDGVESKIPVKQSFAVISKPNSAVISADKMNVVYRGVENPMTISIPGIPDNKVRASAPGLKKVRGSKYNMVPGKGREIKISASGTLPDGKKVSTVTKFRIKDIPAPQGTVRKQSGSVTIPKSSLEISSIGAVLEDFDFDITLKTVSFKFKVPGQPTISINGDRLDSRAKSALRRAKAGQSVQVFDIKVVNPKNPSYKFKKISPVICQLVN